MIRVWRLCAPGLGGAGHLPEAGGVMDQAVVMTEALAVMGAAEQELRRRRGT